MKRRKMSEQEILKRTTWYCIPQLQHLNRHTSLVRREKGRGGGGEKGGGKRGWKGETGGSPRPGAQLGFRHGGTLRPLPSVLTR